MSNSKTRTLMKKRKKLGMQLFFKQNIYFFNIQSFKKSNWLIILSEIPRIIVVLKLRAQILLSHYPILYIKKQNILNWKITSKMRYVRKCLLREIARTGHYVAK